MTEVLVSLSFLFKDPENGTGFFHSDLVVSTLSSYYSQVHGTVDIHDVHHSLHYCSKRPISTIALSLTTVSSFFFLILTFANVEDIHPHTLFLASMKQVIVCLPTTIHPLQCGALVAGHCS